MPMGPVTLADRVGLDICMAVAEDLSEIHEAKAPDFLERWVKEGRLGLKSGRGFYNYEKGKIQKSKESSVYKYQADVPDRLILRICNEAVACLREGIVEDGDLLDAGMVFGTGFAPFRGGVMQYVSTVGKDEMIEKLDRLEQTYGKRFAKDAGWKKV